MDSDIYLHISLQGLHISLAHRILVINTYQVNDDENLDTPLLKNMVMDFLSLVLCGSLFLKGSTIESLVLRGIRC